MPVEFTFISRSPSLIHRILIPLLFALTLATNHSLADRANIVLIMVDDMGFSDIGCYGGTIDTPHLNQLAAEGMRFTQFYNNAKCTTTRASMLTGLYPRGHKLEKHLRSNMLTLGEALRDAGYATSLSGKWHLGGQESTHPFHRGFNRFYGLLDGACNFFDPAIRDPDYKGGRLRVFGHDAQLVTEFPDDFYTTDAFTDHAIESVRIASAANQPFFVHIPYTAPHYPLHARPEDIEKYIGKFKMGWDEMRRQRWQRQKAMGLASSSWRLTGDDSRAYAWESAHHDFEDRRMAVYAAMVDRVDQNIGRLLDVLHETGEAENTVILFFSDNGGCAEEPGGRDPNQRNPGPKDDYVAVGPAWGWAQNTPFRRYKSWLHEGGITTPMIAWWPNTIPAKTITRDPAHIIDLMPTFLEIANHDYPQHSAAGVELLPLEGISLLPLLKGKSRIGHDQLCWQWSGNRAIRQGNLKLVWDKLRTPGAWELYDLENDRCETNDIAAAHPELVRTMAKRWTEWAIEMEQIKPSENEVATPK